MVRVCVCGGGVAVVVCPQMSSMVSLGAVAGEQLKITKASHLKNKKQKQKQNTYSFRLSQCLSYSAVLIA